VHRNVAASANNTNDCAKHCKHCNKHEERRHRQPTMRPHAQHGHASLNTESSGQVMHTRRLVMLTMIAAQRVTILFYRRDAQRYASPTKGSDSCYVSDAESTPRNPTKVAA
jgi:hypothetical protein